VGVNFAPRSARSSRRRPDAGFTIAEVAMAAFVMAFGITSSIMAMQFGFKTVDVARGTTLASQILQSEMERLRMKSWTDMSAMATATDNVLPTPNGTTSGNPAGVEKFDGATYFSTLSDIAGKYLITRTVAADSTRPTEMINITISVQWTDSVGKSHTRSFQSKYSKNGLYDYLYTLAGGT
jgi:Tfp pilus assembly protein PilV